MESPRRRVTIVGAGYVGLVTAVGLASLEHQVEVVETRPDRLSSLKAGRVPIHEVGLQAAFETVLGRHLQVSERPTSLSDVAMICVGTPTGPDGRADLNDLRSALSKIEHAIGEDAPLVIRSTLPPGSTGRVVAWSGVPASRVFVNPEFLRQGTALAEFLHPSRIVIGRFPDADPRHVELVSRLYDRLDAPQLLVDVTAAEMIKNAANAFLALKLSFVNEIAALCDEYGCDVDTVLGGIARDPRIGSQYMQPGFGFGGSCLPKDLRALAVAGFDAGLPMHVVAAASEANHASQVRFAQTIAAAAGGTRGRVIGLLGLAFKAGTDDVRDSPSLGVARFLLEGGARIQAHDPEASANGLAALPGLEIAREPADALAHADVAVIATEWPLYRQLPWGSIRKTMASPVIVDGRRSLDAQSLRTLGYRVIVLGSGSLDGATSANPRAGFFSTNTG